MRLADTARHSVKEPVIMGIVNVTPDSFSDRGRFVDADTATEHAAKLVLEGADIIDVGGQSTRPGADPTSQKVEAERVIPAIEKMSSSLDVPISIDTCRVEVAERAVRAGASMVNDISAFRLSPDMAGFCAENEVDVCLMHMQGEPRTMQDAPRYDDVVSEVKSFLAERLEFAASQGIDERRIVLDPGIGFGKTFEHNLEILAHLDDLVELGRPVLVGTSRKSFIGQITGKDVGDRLAGTVASNVLAYMNGAKIFRVHDVAANRDALAVARDILAANSRTVGA